MPLIHIFRTGKHTAMQGMTLEFSEQTLAAACAAYKPSIHEAPLVIGHPTDTAPAYGWVKGLSMEGGNVLAECGQVNPDFSEMVNSGAFNKVSASWYGPTHPANPAPGTYYLRHVGFLGAQPPAIKGLAPVNFAEGGEVVTVEFGEVSNWQRASGWRAVYALLTAIRDKLIEDDGLEKADAILPRWRLDDLSSVAEAEANADTPAAPAFSEPTPKKEPPVADPTKDDVTAEAAKLALAQLDFAERQKVFRTEQNGAYLDTLVAQGRPLPMPKPDMLNFMEVISADSMVVDFAEGTGTVKKPALDVFKTMLKAMPATVDFSERSGGDGGGGDGELDAQALAALALDYQEKQRVNNVTVTMTEAVAWVQKQQNGGAK